MLVWLAVGAGGPAAIDGYWLTADRTAIVRIAACGTKLCGTISRVLAQGPKVPRTDVKNAHPALRSRQLVGLQILSAFSHRGPDWVNGAAYDPKTGRTYKARLSTNPDGTLTVTGCVLFICRSQTWHRP